ncbi:MAG: hypothetical protein FD180_2173 [Planctomycetota bacterium]|nr:MAG: hypothetical protein FD180_2173 [Planctomycetota bacterium]
MIRINLLPADRRKREAGPWPRMSGLIAAAALLAITSSAALWNAHVANRLGNDVAGRERDLVKARASSAETARLEAELAPLRQKAEIVARVERARRVTWARRLDRVAEILDRDAPRVWLSSARGTQSPGGAPEATLELACEAAPDPAKPAPMGQVSGEFVEALRRTFLGPGGEFTRYDDRYSEKATPRGGTVEGWSEAFTVRLFRDRAATAPPR